MHRRHNIIVNFSETWLTWDAIVYRIKQLETQLRMQERNGAETAEKTTEHLKKLIAKYYKIEAKYRLKKLVKKSKR